MTFEGSGTGRGLKKPIPEIREREGNGKIPFPKFGNGKGTKKNPFPKFGNGKGMKKSIPILRERLKNICQLNLYIGIGYILPTIGVIFFYWRCP